MPPYDPLAVANYFIRKGTEDNKYLITPMKLQKLIYFAHGWHLGIIGSPLIDELCEAWDYGPVIQSVYHEFKKYGNKPITRLADQFQFSDVSDKSLELDDCLEFYTPEINPKDIDTKKLLDRILKVYGDKSALYLSQLTHLPGTPWEVASKEAKEKGVKGYDIKNEDIRAYFKKNLIKKS